MLTAQQTSETQSSPVNSIWCGRRVNEWSIWTWNPLFQSECLLLPVLRFLTQTARHFIEFARKCSRAWFFLKQVQTRLAFWSNLNFLLARLLLLCPNVDLVKHWLPRKNAVVVWRWLRQQVGLMSAPARAYSVTLPLASPAISYSWFDLTQQTSVSASLAVPLTSCRGTVSLSQ